MGSEGRLNRGMAHLLRASWALVPSAGDCLLGATSLPHWLSCFRTWRWLWVARRLPPRPPSLLSLTPSVWARVLLPTGGQAQVRVFLPKVKSQG